LKQGWGEGGVQEAQSGVGLLYQWITLSPGENMGEIAMMMEPEGVQKYAPGGLEIHGTEEAKALTWGEKKNTGGDSFDCRTSGIRRKKQR